jgi:membrane associated rhomboid family serine protease
MPRLTVKLLWATLASLLLSALPGNYLQQLILWPIPAGVDAAMGMLGQFRPWQLVTHLLVNPGLLNLLFVGLTIYYFGVMLESAWGARRYGLFLLACAVGSTLLQFAVSTAAFAAGVGPYAPTSGADGVMYGILFACTYLWPRQEVMLMIPPIPVRMQTLVIVLCLIKFWFGLWGGGMLSQFGFLGGLAAAWLHIRYWRGQPPFSKKKPPPPKFRIVH